MVYLFLADGFEETEALTTLDILRRAGIDTQTVGVTGEFARGRSGITVKCDISEAAALRDDAKIEALVFPGGMPGASNIDESASVDKFIEKATARNAILAAICAAPFILGVRGLLRGKKATCFPGFEDKLDDAFVVDAPAVRDGNIITGKAMGCTFEFALMLVAALRGDDAAEKIRKSVFFGK